MQDAIAVVAAHSTAADPELLAQSARDLDAVARQSERDLGQVQRLIRHLGVSTMAEAATVLCRAGRKQEARQMLALSQETEGVAVAQIDVGLFLQECLDNLSGFAGATVRQSEGGRLIGSA
ncbi:hypothetical protein ACS8Y6_05830 [Salinisphaera sp. RV14]|uniref:hypothetical protein n=1 Tax=unclassified Salinisphaera TaxID=2649847 RepID=UPI003F8509CD